MNRLLLRGWQRTLRRVGTPGVLGLVLLVPTLAIALWLPRLERHADGLRAALKAQANAVARQDPPARRPMSKGEQALEFMAGFPTLMQSAGDLDKVFALARRSNVTLLKGEYQLKAEPNAPLVSYSASFPVQNDYAALKDFTARVLRALPHASLDELRMTRAEAGGGMLDSMVRFTFVYRSL